MAESLGEKLRLAREAAGITISEVAAQTRIASRYLEAIEEDNYKPLPGGVFNKGFIKSYAKYVGVDEQEALADYNRLVASQTVPDEEETRNRRPTVMTDDRNRSSASSLIFAIIILVLMSGGIYALVQWYRSEPADPSKNPAANSNSNSNANSAGINPLPTPLPATDKIEVELRSTAGGAEAPSVTTSVDGGKTESGVITPDAPRKYTAQTSLKISYSKYQAAKVQLLLNGQQVILPATPLKASEQVIRFEITKDNVAQILTAGMITLGEPAAANPNANTNVAAPTDTNTAGAPAATPAAATPKPATPKPTATPVKTTTPATNPTVITVPPAKTPAPGAPAMRPANRP